MYKVDIVSCTDDLSAKERVMLKDVTEAKKLDDMTQQGAIIISPKMYATLHVTNDKADNGEYDLYVIVDKDNEKYVTSSESFWTSFLDITAEMENETEDWSIKVYRMPSKNYKGKEFITCSII